VTISTDQRMFGSVFKRTEMKAVGMLDQGVIDAARRGATKLARQVMPKGVTGNMRRATTVRIYQKPGASKTRASVVCAIVVNVPYAKAIEMGTRPFTPPIAPLIAWVRFKFGLYGRDAVSAAYAVRAKIQLEGITPQWNVRDFLPELRAMLEPALRAAYVKRASPGAGLGA
jgi:hypothetical protein